MTCSVGLCGLACSLALTLALLPRFCFLCLCRLRGLTGRVMIVPLLLSFLGLNPFFFLKPWKEAEQLNNTCKYQVWFNCFTCWTESVAGMTHTLGVNPHFSYLSSLLLSSNLSTATVCLDFACGKIMSRELSQLNRYLWNLRTTFQNCFLFTFLHCEILPLQVKAGQWEDRHRQNFKHSRETR